MVPTHPPTHADLDFYTRPAAMTSPGRHAALLDDLPDDPAGLAKVLHGLIVHEHLTEVYGFTLPEKRRATVHVRQAGQLLDRIVADDDRPLTEPREPARRLAGNCRHYTVLLVTMLRAKGVPARARCGFGDYFGSSWFEDHWVAEYWNADQQRWIFVDAQLDDVLRGALPIDFDPTDVARDRFLVAGEAWTRCQAGEADPSLFGFSFLKESGYWWIAGNMVRDLAALNNMEMLPWDVWGAMPDVDETVDDERLPLFVRLAELTRTPLTSVDELADVYRDERLRVPSTVHNAILTRDEPVPSAPLR